ncbi:MAG: autotransporter domain-containing protein [Pseudomonadota bacterium]
MMEAFRRKARTRVWGVGRETHGSGSAACWLALLLALTGGARAQTIGELAVFGDNVADPGNIPALLEAGNQAGLGPVDTNFPPSPPYFGNRYSNGPVAAELLPGLPGIEADSVVNLAVGNAFSAQLPVSLAGGVLIGNGSSIPGPIGRGLAALNETDITSRVNAYLSSRQQFAPDDLMLIYMSANDGALALNTIGLTGLTGAEAQNLILQGATANARNTVAAAGQLVAAGAQQVVLANLPDIGATPAAAAGGLAGVAAASGFSQVANDALAQGAAQLATDTGAVITVFDSFTLLNDITANPGRYGLTDTTNPCLAVPTCVGDPSQADQFLFWDSFFPTARVQSIAAAALADTINAPKTLASQAETTRYAAEKFAQSLLSDLGRQDHEQTPAGWRLRLAYDRFDWQRDGETFAFGYDAQLDRITLAAEFIGSEMTAGLALSSDRGDVDHRGIAASHDFDSLRFGAFLARHGENWSIGVAVHFADEELDNIRRVTGVAGQIATGESDGDSLSLLLQMQRSYDWNRWRLSPTLRLGYSESELDEYLETGAVAMNQRVGDRRATNNFAEVGISASSAWSTQSGGGWRLRPLASLFYRSQLGDRSQEINSRLATVQEVVRTFAIDTPDDDYWRLALALEADLSERLSLQLGGTLEEGANRLDGYSAGLSLQYQW